MKNYMPVVRMGKITLRDITSFDYLDYYDIGRDFETTKYLNWGPFNNPNEALWVIKEIFFQRPINGLPVGYAIEYDGKMIGMIDFHTYYSYDNSAEIGYILHRDYQNRGIMTKCLREMVKLGFYHLDLDKIIVGHSSLNEASKRVILKCGFKYETQKIVRLKDYDDIGLYYAIYRYEYEEE